MSARTPKKEIKASAVVYSPKPSVPKNLVIRAMAINAKTTLIILPETWIIVFLATRWDRDIKIKLNKLTTCPHPRAPLPTYWTIDT